MKERNDRLLPLLLDIEEDLEQDLSLGALASRFGGSEFHFHRSFTETLGETPKKHVERLRLEKAAMQLAVGAMPITELAFSLGFQNLETFSRRFKAALGHSPTEYRRMARAAQAERVQSRNFHDSKDYFLSRARFGSLPDMHLLALRHLGGYGQLNTAFGQDDSVWTEVRRLAESAGLRTEPLFVGFFLDDPTMTPQSQRRADVCIKLREKAEAPGKSRYIEFKGGLYASAEYVGDSPHLLQAYQGLADEIRRSPRYDFRAEVTSLLFPRSANVGGQSGIHAYEVCFPVRRV